MVALLGCVTVGAYGAPVLAGEGPVPAYAGTHLELVGSCAFATGTVVACLALARCAAVARLAVPLAATGQMALTAYTVQVLVLIAWQQGAGAGFDDDRWSVLVVTVLVCVGGSWLWTTLVGRGPLEWLSRLPLSVARSRSLAG